MSQGALFAYGEDRPWTPKKASTEALEALPLKTVREDHRKILVALLDGPLCDADLLAVTGCHPNAIRARRGELVTAGLVKAMPEPVIRNGRKVTAWALVSR